MLKTVTTPCGGCGREIHADRSSCLYCGWTASEGAAAPTAIRPVAGAEEPATFRAGATTWRFLVWAVLACAAGLLLGRRAESEPVRRLALACWILGPLAFAAQLLRVALVKVVVDPREGLLTRGRRIPWSEIDGVDYAGVRVAVDQAILRHLLDGIRSAWSGGGVIGFQEAILRILATVLLALLVLLVALVSGVLLPVLVLLSPWQPRVVVRLRGGGPLVWRDLTREGDFVRRVSAGIR